jgi:acetolactate synthase regulatory subunit
MPTTPSSVAPAPAPRAPSRAPRRVADIRLRDAPDAITRVLATLRRRSCVVVAIDFWAGDRHRPGRLTIEYEAPPRCATAVPAWLTNLVDVLEVRDRAA